MARQTTEVIATSKHPNRPEGEHYQLTTALVESLQARGFVILPTPPEPEPEPPVMLPKVIKVIKPKAKRK